MKLDDCGVVDIAWLPTKDQTDFDWYGLQIFYVDLACKPRHENQYFHYCALGLSRN